MHKPEKLIEALIFASPEPIEASALSEIISDLTPDQINAAVASINEDYKSTGRPFRIIHSAGGFRYVTEPEFGIWIKRLIYRGGRLRLSRAALETISIIAYKQPISRNEIEALRGVDTAGIIRMLLERKLIEIKARAPRTGRSLLYGTTQEFLRYFGLNSVEELPKPEEISEPHFNSPLRQKEMLFKPPGG